MKLLKQNSQQIIYIVISFLTLLGIIYFFWIIPRQRLQDFKPFLQPKEYIELENSIRTGLAQAIGGVAILTGLFFTWRNIKATEKNLKITQETTSKNLSLSQEGQITERFTRAVEQLGNDKLQVRLGGIYALERIARDSKADYWAVIEILSAFVRANICSENVIGDDEFEVPADVQAVLNVLSRRNLSFEQNSIQRIDLRGANLKGANLVGCNLEKALLWKTHFEGANLRDIHLEDAGLYKATLNSAKLISAHLERASIVEAQMENAVCSNAFLEEVQLNGSNLRFAKLYDTNLSGANLLEADLSGASLLNANLSGAILKRTKLDGADLKGADLSGAIYLTLEQVTSAINYNGAKLPLYIQKAIERKDEGI